MSSIQSLRREITYVAGMLRVRAKYKDVAKHPHRLTPDWLAE